MRTLDMDSGKRLILMFFFVFQLVLLGLALLPTAYVAKRYVASVTTPVEWTLLIILVVVVFNYAYALALLLFRLILPKPPEGYFPRGANGRPPKEALLLMLNLLLVKARFHTPWSSMFTSVIVNIFPLNILFCRFFGPQTSSVTLGDTFICLDPYLVRAGRNVQFGFNSTIIGHLFDHRGLLIRAVTIGDNAVVGGHSIIMPGTSIGHHAVVGSKSLVLPGTIIGPYELWAGTPARKIRDLTPDEGPSEYPYGEDSSE